MYEYRYYHLGNDLLVWGRHLHGERHHLWIIYRNRTPEVANFGARSDLEVRSFFENAATERTPV